MIPTNPQNTHLVPHDISSNTRRDLQDEHNAEQDGKLEGK